MIQKYAAALISVAIVLVAYLSQVGDGAITAATFVQLASLTVAAIGTYVVRLTTGKWQASLKVLLPVLAALFSAIYPFVVAGHITGTQMAVVGLAVLQALGAQVGADIRLDGSRRVGAVTADD